MCQKKKTEQEIDYNKITIPSRQEIIHMLEEEHIYYMYTYIYTDSVTQIPLSKG